MALVQTLLLAGAIQAAAIHGNSSSQCLARGKCSSNIQGTDCCDGSHHVSATRCDHGIRCGCLGNDGTECVGFFGDRTKDCCCGSVFNHACSGLFMCKACSAGTATGTKTVSSEMTEVDDKEASGNAKADPNEAVDVSVQPSPLTANATCIPNGQCAADYEGTECCHGLHHVVKQRCEHGARCGCLEDPQCMTLLTATSDCCYGITFELTCGRTGIFTRCKSKHEATMEMMI